MKTARASEKSWKFRVFQTNEIWKPKKSLKNLLFFKTKKATYSQLKLFKLKKNNKLRGYSWEKTEPNQSRLKAACLNPIYELIWRMGLNTLRVIKYDRINVFYLSYITRPQQVIKYNQINVLHSAGDRNRQQTEVPVNNVSLGKTVATLNQVRNLNLVVG